MQSAQTLGIAPRLLQIVDIVKASISREIALRMVKLAISVAKRITLRKLAKLKYNILIM